jgi:hypothetical protein
VVGTRWRRTRTAVTASTSDDDDDHDDDDGAYQDDDDDDDDDADQAALGPVVGPFPEGVSDRGWDAMAEDPDGRYGIDQR